MVILLDTDVIIHDENCAFDLNRWLTSHQADKFEMAAVSVAELWQASNKRRERGSQVATFNKKQFGLIEGLKVIELVHSS